MRKRIEIILATGTVETAIEEISRGTIGPDDDEMTFIGKLQTSNCLQHILVAT